MKIRFPNYCPGELLARKRGASHIISSGVIVFFCWCSRKLRLGGAAGIFLNSSKVDQAHTVPIKENVPRITSQWDYRPRKPIRAPAIFDSPSAEASVVLSPDSFGINNNVWFSGDSLEGAAPTFINPQPDGGELMTKALSETTDTVCAAPTVDDAAVSRYD